MEIHILYMYIEGRYIIYLYELWKQVEKRAFGELFCPVSQLEQINLIFSNNVRKLCLSCNVKKSKITARFSEKSRKKRIVRLFSMMSSYTVTFSRPLLYLSQVAVSGHICKTFIQSMQFNCSNRMGSG